MLFLSVAGRKATLTITAVNRMGSLARKDSNVTQIRENLNQYKEESARVWRFCFSFYVALVMTMS